MHQGAVKRASRNTPPVILMASSTSDSASMIFPTNGQVFRRPGHSGAAPCIVVHRPTDVTDEKPPMTDLCLSLLQAPLEKRHPNTQARTNTLPHAGDTTVNTATDKLVILVTKGIDSELSSVAFTIALGGMTAGLKVSMFLTSTAIDLVRRGGQRMTQVAPLESLAAMIEDFQKRGGVIWACTPCVKSRGYEQSDLLDGVIVTGSSVMHAEVKQGAATLSF
jgi:predicted peroxiredoxin